MKLNRKASDSGPGRLFTKISLVMRLTAFLLLVGCLQVSAGSIAQTITISEKSASLEKIFKQIEKQTSYVFFYDDRILQNTRKVDVSVKNASIEQVLLACLKDTPLKYRIVGNTIIVVMKSPGYVLIDSLRNKESGIGDIDVRGRVVDENGEPISGVTVTIKGTHKGTSTNTNGEFNLFTVDADAILLFTGANVETFEVKINGKIELAVRLKTKISGLDEVQIIAYGTTTKRKNTGSISTIKREEIANQPVTNILSAISGRASGVFVQTTNGLPGGNVNIQIRGKGSILAGTDPLYVVDGVPFSSSVVPSSSAVASSSINGVISPFNSLNPADIESITILKDADATAIYGSRGTNGVVLITTKKGKPGKSRIDLNVSEGQTKIANYPNLLNLQQYLQIRREAFINDGKTPSADPASANYAPDLMVWDTTKSTDWAKYLLGGTGYSTNAQMGLSGGNDNTTFNVSGNFHRESTVLPGNSIYQRAGLLMSIQHTSLDKRFTASFSSTYNSDNNRLVNPVNNISTDLILPPNYPLFDAAGNYNWNISNPLAELKAVSKTRTDNAIVNGSLGYALLKGLNLKVSGGYNKININQVEPFPTASLYPGTTNYTYFGANSNQSIIIEPQIDFHARFGKSSLSVLAGATYQDRISQGETIKASGFSSESLLENIGSAGTFTPSNVYTEYKYESIFSRLTYSLTDRYILNATVRRDGSSRFGPGNRYGNFGSIGGAWILSNEKWLKNSRIVSFAKLRGSYGVTGNDQIPDYQYLSTYGSSSTYNYQGISALVPSRIANADFHWETTNKVEYAVELSFFKDRVSIGANRYMNRSKDQLVAYAIPQITGFSTYQANLPAVIENSGWEFEMNTKNIQKRNFSWNTTINVTFPRNVLKSFENFSSSSYSQTLELGYDITRIYGYRFLGIDPTTGKGSYAPLNETTAPTPYFYFRMGKQTPDFFGGIGNTVTYGDFQLDVFGQFAAQKARGGITYPPGQKYNNYATILSRWSKQGDLTNVPKPSLTQDFYYASSSVNYFDASYFRLKNVSLSYTFSPALTRKIKITQLRLYLQGQNLYTIWDRNSAILDPESGALTVSAKNIPPMKALVFGLQVSL